LHPLPFLSQFCRKKNARFRSQTTLLPHTLEIIYNQNPQQLRYFKGNFKNSIGAGRGIRTLDCRKGHPSAIDTKSALCYYTFPLETLSLFCDNPTSYRKIIASFSPLKDERNL
jgi:hypothetical protein